MQPVLERFIMVDSKSNPEFVAKQCVLTVTGAEKWGHSEFPSLPLQNDAEYAPPRTTVGAAGLQEAFWQSLTK